MVEEKYWEAFINVTLRDEMEVIHTKQKETVDARGYHVKIIVY